MTKKNDTNRAVMLAALVKSSKKAGSRHGQVALQWHRGSKGRSLGLSEEIAKDTGSPGSAKTRTMNTRFRDPAPLHNRRKFANVTGTGRKQYDSLEVRNRR